MLRHFSLKNPVLAICLVFLASACHEAANGPTATYRKQILSERAVKDSLFAIAGKSPMPATELKDFHGLHYYDVDPQLRFEGPIIPVENAPIDTILGSKGDKRPAQKFGYFKFDYQGKFYQLAVYRMLSRKPGFEDYLFLGFFDVNSGESTYGGGRYIDLTLNPQNHYTVDFNLAYNPYCAYGGDYSCAVPPLENKLDFALNAGEKSWH